MTGLAPEASSDFAEFLSDGYLAANPPRLQRLCIAAYRLLACGEPVYPHALAEAASCSLRELDELTALIPASAYARRQDGAFAGFIGLTIEPTAHEFAIGSRKHYTWCVFDALFLPALLQCEAVLTTCCPATGQTITVRIASRRAEAVSPSRPVMSIVAPDKTACCKDLRGAFCNHVNFFADEAAFVRWNDGAGVCVALDDAFALAMRRNKARFPDIDLRN